MRSRRRAIAWTVAGTTAAALACTWLAGELLSRPARRTLGAPPPALQGQTIALRTDTGEAVAGWAADGRPGGGAVLLLHGVRSDRRQMLDRAQWLHREGYAVVLIDLPAHGESSGDRITFGQRESAGVQAALAEMARRWPRERIGVIGVSLGAASAVLAPALPGVKALVLESMYPTIDDATRNRLRHVLGPPGAMLTPALLWQLPLRAGVSPGALRPIDHMATLPAPVLILGGAVDAHTTPAETMRLQAATGPTARMWLVPGAAHVDLHGWTRTDYERRVGAFLQEHLRPTPLGTDS